MSSFMIGERRFTCGMKDAPEVSLIMSARHELVRLQESEYACEQNDMAINCIDEALGLLAGRE